jgi:2-dehydropantoate 2-reductase
VLRRPIELAIPLWRAAIAAQAAVHYKVPPASGSILGVASDALTPEARLFQGPLFGEVVCVRAGFEPLDERVVEQILSQRSLGGGTQSVSAVLRKQADTDIQGTSGAGWSVSGGRPTDEASHDAITVLDDQRRHVIADQTIGGEPSFKGVRCGEAVEAKGIIARLATTQQRNVDTGHRPQTHTNHAAILTPTSPTTDLPAGTSTPDEPTSCQDQETGFAAKSVRFPVTDPSAVTIIRLAIRPACLWLEGQIGARPRAVTRGWQGGGMRILVVGAGVIGSVYAGHLLRAGHEVTMLARGRRLADLTESGLVLDNAESGQREVLPVTAVDTPGPGARYELVLVAVRAEQLPATLPVLVGMPDGLDVLFFGSTAGRSAQLREALGQRALFGFPAAGGVRDGPAIRYVLISQQQTMLGEATGTVSDRVQQLRTVLQQAGFPTTISTNIDGWLLGHAAFIVPIAFALYRVDTDPARLASDRQALRTMVRATRQAFRALSGTAEIPANLRALYRLPSPAAVSYWRRVMAGPRGELWFAAHSRAAPQEINSMAGELQTAIRHVGYPTPDLDTLLTTPAT